MQVVTDGWMTQKDAAAHLGVSHTTVINLVASGRLPYLNTPHGRIYDPEAVEALRRERSGEAPESGQPPAAGEAQDGPEAAQEGG